MFKSPSDLEQFVSSTLLELISPLAADELHFLEDLADILRRIVTGEALSDSQKQMFSTENPFTTESLGQDISLACSAFSTQSACEIEEGEESKLIIEESSEVMSCCSISMTKGFDDI